MKFWVIVIAATLLVSGGVTWLYLHQGGQLDEGLGVLTTTPAGGKLEFDDLKMEANVVNLSPGPTKMNETKTVAIAFRNAGDGPLKLQFVRSSCRCLEDVSVDDVKLVKGAGNTVTKGPGEKGEIRIRWTPRKDNCQECDKERMLIAVEMWANDPRPQFHNPFRFEILTRVADDEAPSTNASKP